jgi:tetratricopeptide (TPR) repeat protein
VKSILFSTLFFLLALQSFAQEQLLQVAKQYLLAGNYEKAVITYKQLAEYNPDDVSIQQDYVSCLMALKDYKTAETVLKKLIKTSKNKSQYDYTLAKLWLAQGETKKANKIFDKLIDAVPPVEKEYRALADSL